MRSKSIAIALLGLAVGCGSSQSRELPPLTPEEQAEKYFESPGSQLLAFAPAGAQAVLEVDLRRLRDNSAIGELVEAVAQLRADTGLGFDPLRDADVILFCAYGLGSSEAATLTLVRSTKLADLAGSERLAEGVVAIGSPAMRKRARALVAGKAKAVSDDAAFMKTRDRAVPNGAPGASLRLTAVLDFDSRVSMARVFDLDRVPTALSVWGDVVDDLAIVGILGADSEKEARGLVKASRLRLQSLAANRWIERLVLGYLLRSVKVTAQKRSATLVLLIQPERLALLSKRLARYARSAGQRKSPAEVPASQPPSPSEKPET